MAAMKPRTGDGPMEAVKEGRLIIVRVPLEGGGRLVVSVSPDEAKELHGVLEQGVRADEEGDLARGAGCQDLPTLRSRSAAGQERDPWLLVG